MSGRERLTPVWVVAEEGAREATLEALGEAAELARPAKPGVMAVGPPETRATLAALAAWGAGRLVLLRTPDPAAAAAIGRAAAAWLERQGDPAPVVLLPHTRHGLTVAAQLTVRLDAALAPDAVGVRRGSGGDPRHVDVHIRNLRRKIEDDPARPRRVETIRGRGYRFGLAPS